MQPQPFGYAMPSPGGRKRRRLLSRYELNLALLPRELEPAIWPGLGGLSALFGGFDLFLGFGHHDEVDVAVGVEDVHALGDRLRALVGEDRVRAFGDLQARANP